MQSRLTRKLVLGSLFAAMIFVVTYMAKWPIGSNGAIITAGDGIVYTAGIAMSGPWAAFAAGIGSMLSDIVGGSAIYAPATFVIKALMGLVVGLALYGRKTSWIRNLIFMCLASLIMVFGYYAYEFFLYTPHGVQALIDMPANFIQAAIGVVIGVPLALVVRRIIPINWLDAFKRQDKINQ